MGQIVKDLLGIGIVFELFLIDIVLDFRQSIVVGLLGIERTAVLATESALDGFEGFAAFETDVTFQGHS